MPAQTRTQNNPTSPGSNNQHCVIVTVLEGRHFAKRTNCKLYAQCRFNQEILTTDPVPHVQNPIFDTELAWNLSTRALHFLRSQRSSLKLTVHSIDPVSARRETVGFVMLDLRAAKDSGGGGEKWWPLVNAKVASGGLRPELKMEFAVVVEGAAEAEKARVSGREKTLGASEKSGTGQPISKASVLVLPRPDEGYCQIGPEEGLGNEGGGDTTQFWRWAVTIAFAENLDLLLQPPPAPRGCHFALRILGRDFRTASFSDVKAPSFASEQICVRLRGSLKSIALFLKELGRVQIYFVKEDDTGTSGTALGFAEVRMDALVMVFGDDDGNGGVVEKVYPIYDMRMELPISATGATASVGVALSLAKEDPTDAENDGSVRDGFAVIGGPHRYGKRNHISGPKTVTESRADPKSNKNVGAEYGSDIENEGVSTGPEKSSPLVHNAAEPAHRSTSNFEWTPVAKPTEDPPLSQPEQARSPARKNPQSTNSVLHSAILPPPRPTSRSQIYVAPPWHQYRFSIELRSLRDIRLPASTHLYLRYAYPGFGTPGRVLTHPPTSVPARSAGGRTAWSEVYIPNAFCAFEFVMSGERLQTYLEAVPLVVEVCEKDGYTRDTVIGKADVDLHCVWDAPRMRVEIGGGSGGDQGDQRYLPTVRKWETLVAVVGSGKGTGTVKVADLRVLMSLEDFGPVEDHAVEVDGGKAEKSAGKRYPGHGMLEEGDSSMVAMPMQATPPGTPPESVLTGTRTTTSIHETAEYRVALELELWRAEEERKFREQLKAQEEELLTELTREWKRREAEREASHKKKLEEFKALELQMNTLVSELEVRERKLTKGEEELSRKKADLEREGERRLDEARDAARRVQEECKHRVEVEKARATEADAARGRAVREREMVEQRLKSVEDEFVAYRKQMNGMPEAMLRAQAASAAEESRMWKERSEILAKQKNAYKTKWATALKELARLRKEMETEREDGYRRRAREVEMLRAQALQKEELGNEKATLEELKRQMELLMMHSSVTKKVEQKEAGRKRKDSILSESEDGEEGRTDGGGGLSPWTLEEIGRLKRERDFLLETGMYTSDDELPRQLNRRVAQLKSG
ncbi:Cep120 protein-domain-containing protein [Cladochytrium replicatum]|nr:Cep120 protein-domain-containing protein [Cladochytrium replicatum]